MSTTPIKPRRLWAKAGAALALAFGLLIASTSPAAADPITYGDGDELTFSDTTLDPSQSFTITDDLQVNVPLNRYNIGTFYLFDASKVVYDGCTVVTGPGTCDLNISGEQMESTIDYGAGLPANTHSVVEWDFHVATDATGTIDYEMYLYTDVFNEIYYDSGSLTINSGADLSVAVADSADPVSVGGSPYTYTVTVGNAGSSGATGVSVSTTLSGAARAINSATPSQGSCSISAPTVSCSLGSIATSGGATVTISVTPSATGTLTATSTVSGNESDPVATNNSDAESTTVNNALGCSITGTSGNDTLNGTNGADVICGLGGNDTIDGGNGNDTIYAGDGDDNVGGGNGADTIYGGAGNDDNKGETLLGSLLYLFDNGSDTIYGGPGNDDLDGQNGDDILYDHEGTDSMSGNVGNDDIDVQDGTGGDTASGGLGNDTCAVDGGDSSSGC